MLELFYCFEVALTRAEILAFLTHAIFQFHFPFCIKKLSVGVCLFLYHQFHLIIKICLKSLVSKISKENWQMNRVVYAFENILCFVFPAHIFKTDSQLHKFISGSFNLYACFYKGACFRVGFIWFFMQSILSNSNPYNSNFY